MSSGDLMINSAGNLILAGSSGSFSFSGDAYILNTADFRSTTAVDGDNSIVNDFTLFQNYPNPFNPATNIKFNLPASGFVTLKVYDILGNELSTLVNEHLNSGTYSTEFKGENLASGIYIYSIRMDGLVQSRKMILLK